MQTSVSVGSLAAKTNAELVSIIVPAYNAARTIDLMINSVLKQTHSCWELIICDDASGDDTVRRVESYSDPRIRLLKNATNLGEGRTRDRAVKNSRGTWLAMLDADDAWVPGRLDRLLEVGREFPDAILIDDMVDCHDTPHGLVPWSTVWGEKSFGVVALKPQIISFEDFLSCDRLPLKPFVRSDLVRRCGARHGSSSNGSDMAFFLGLSASGVGVCYVPDAMYLYRMTPGSASTTVSKRHTLYRKVFEDALPMFAGDERAVAALRSRIRRVQKTEEYYNFFLSVVNGRYLTAAISFVKQPWLGVEFLRRCMHRIPYHLHRLWHGGVWRSVR